MSSPRRIAAFCLAAVAGSATLLVAGPLAPPAGPVASTMKTLAEIEPRTVIGVASTPGNAEATFAITQPGSYYLTAPLAGTPGKFGIKIYASNVTIDLGGFELVGSPGTTWAGIATGPGVAGLSIRDGVLSGWGSGIDLANADGCTFERLRVVGGREQGFYAGAHACITDCISSGQSQGGGIFAGLVRGRAGRQGDPGESRFFVSLEDQLWKIFNSKMMENPVLKAWPPMEEVRAKFITGMILKTQERIENHFFEARKHVLEYDDVLNAQRKSHSPSVPHHPVTQQWAPQIVT